MTKSTRNDDYDDNLDERLNYTQLALASLYLGKNYVAINEELYQFKDTHYQICNKQLELRRISKWCENFSSKLAEKSKVNNVYEWVIIKLSVHPDKINPEGINLKNGVLRVFWGKDKKGYVKLIKHNPNTIYTYCSDINYNSKADPFHCNKLLECLEDEERKVFLRTIASAFDLPYLRTQKARNSRALILHGDGNNGKDAIRSVTKIIFGHALANCSLSDFLAYQNGQKNGISSLENALVNWNSENVPVGSLNIKPLTAAITGDDLRCKILFKDERDFTPRSVFLFNCNDTPNIKSNAEFIKSRWAIVPFRKTFKSNPNLSQGEIQADPRYKDDPDFIKENIAPAFLNLLVAELETLAIDGIDYSPLDHNIEILKQKSSHLFQFCDDMGIVADTNGKIYINDLWDMLRNWYLDQGILEIEKTDKGKEKPIWNDQSNKYDRNCKAINQVFQRFSEIFPNITKIKETIDQKKIGTFYLTGIGQTASLGSLVDYKRDTASLLLHTNEAPNEATSLIHQGNEPNGAINPILIKNFSHEKKCDLFKLIGTELGIPVDQIEKWLIAKFKISDRVVSLIDTDSLDKYGIGTIDSVFRKEGAFYYYVTFDKVDSSHCYGEDQLKLYQQPEDTNNCGFPEIDFSNMREVENKKKKTVDLSEPLEVRDITLTIKILMGEKEMTKTELNQFISFKFGKRSLNKLDDQELKDLVDYLRNIPSKSERKDYGKNKVMGDQP
jgi:phage/plasmid-associated DNA primase